MGPIVAKVVGINNFLGYLVALIRDTSYSSPFLYLFSSIFDPNKGVLKSPLFVIFLIWVKQGT